MIKPRPSNLLFAILLAFSLATTCWALWGLTSGDYFANGNALVNPTMPGAGIVGACVGYKSRAVIGRILITCATLAAIGFWVFVPDGWWTKPPPGSERVRYNTHV